MPRRLLAAQGENSTLGSIVQAVKASCAVVVVRESGGTAAMVASFIDTLSPPHNIARSQQNPSYPTRFPVRDHLVSWAVQHPYYAPIYFVDASVIDADCTSNQAAQWAVRALVGWKVAGEGEERQATARSASGWADPEDLDRIPSDDPLADRLSFEGPIVFDEGGFPLNPRGRTGIRGRGLLGRWGPNHAADPIVTRFHPRTGQLQMMAIFREDTDCWAIPGGMVKAGDKVRRIWWRRV